MILNQMESMRMERDMGPDTTERPNKTSIGEVKRESQMRYARVEGNRRGDTRRTSDKTAKRRRRGKARPIRMSETGNQSTSRVRIRGTVKEITKAGVRDQEAPVWTENNVPRRDRE